MDMFDSVWDSLAEFGHCDERGSAEYIRCREQWECEGEFLAALRFIIGQADLPADTLPLPDNTPVDGE